MKAAFVNGRLIRSRGRCHTLRQGCVWHPQSFSVVLTLLSSDHKWEEIMQRGLCKATVTWQQIIVCVSERQRERRGADKELRSFTSSLFIINQKRQAEDPPLWCFCSFSSKQGRILALTDQKHHFKFSGWSLKKKKKKKICPTPSIDQPWIKYFYSAFFLSFSPLTAVV